MSAGVRNLNPYGAFRRIKEPHHVWIVAALPPPYQRFYREWKAEDKETPVHWIPKEEEWTRDPETGEVKRHQNVPVKVLYPEEMHRGLWGGEGIVEGLVKKGKYRCPVPKFWVPNFYKTVVHSEILDKYMSVVATERALELIDKHDGLDSYLLKNPAYDLKSLLACKIKRKLLLALMDKDFAHKDVNKQTEFYERFKEYLIPREDAEWYGFSVQEAQIKYKNLLAKQQQPVPLKEEIRKGYLSKWKGSVETGSTAVDEEAELALASSSSSSWTKKLNPFSKGA